LFPPNDSKLARQEYHAHVKNVVEDLLHKGKFLRNGVDEGVKFQIVCRAVELTVLQGHTNNFSHPALEVLCTSFYYGKNGLALQFPKEFKGEVPEKAIALAGAAVCDMTVSLWNHKVSLSLYSWSVPYMNGRMAT
jgi:hypothetical protein